MSFDPNDPRPPYKEEGIFGPGAKKFIGVLLGVAVVAGIAVAALNVDFDSIADEFEQLTTTSTESQQSGGGGGSTNDGGGGGAKSTSEDAGASTLSAAGLNAALGALRDERDGEPDLVRVRATPDSIELAVREGKQPQGYLWSDGELTEQSVVVVVGGGSLKDTDFPASDVDPDSLPRVVRGAERAAGGRKLEVVNATLEADRIDVRKRRWLLNARAPNGSSLTFRAKENGTGVEKLGASGPPGAGLPPEAQQQLEQANKSAECIAKAAGDTDAIRKCVERLGP